MSFSWRILSYWKSLNILQFFSHHSSYSHPIRTFENPIFSFYLANNAYSSTSLPTIYTFIKFSLKKSDEVVEIEKTSTMRVTTICYEVWSSQSGRQLAFPLVLSFFPFWSVWSVVVILPLWNELLQLVSWDRMVLFIEKEICGD